MCVRFYSASQGKEFVDVFDTHLELKPKWVDRHSCVRGYYVSTVGNVNEEMICAYIRVQEEKD